MIKYLGLDIMSEYTGKVYSSRAKEWYLNGNRHREDGPASECKTWFLNGEELTEEEFNHKTKLQKLNGNRHKDKLGNKIKGDDIMSTPIVKLDTYGTKRWYLNDKLHREDGPAVEHASGYKSWYLNGQLNRNGGPAVEYTNGNKEWYLNGKLHREDGPARELHREYGPARELWNGYKEWYLNGVELTEDEFNNKPIPKEMTVQEIEVELGYKIKVMK